MTQLYLYTAWRTPLFRLVSWGRTESLEEKQLPREERPPVASGTKWGHVLWRRGPERFLKLNNGCSVFPLPRYLSFQCTSVRTGPPSSAPKQFSWKMNRSKSHQLWAHGISGGSFARHTPSLTTASPQPWWPHPFSNHSQPSAMVTTPFLLPQPALSHGDHTPSPTRISLQPRWPHPFSNQNKPSAMVTTPLLQPQPALSHGGHTEHLCGTWFPPEAEERPTPPQLPAAFFPALIWSALGSPWSLEDLFSVVEYF